jgi:rare lipoprotein A (RlpA)-like double-psi beta-barrel protein/SH3 domain-containing protein
VVAPVSTGSGPKAVLPRPDIEKIRNGRGAPLNALLRFVPVALILLCLSGAAVASVAAQSPAASGSIATVISTDGLNLRASSSTSGPIVEVIPFAATVTITGASTPDGWYPVSHGSNSGWLAGEFLASGSLDPIAARTAVALSPSTLRTAAASATPSAATLSAAAGRSSTPVTGGSGLQMTVSYYGIDDGTVPGTMMACGAPFNPFDAHAASSNDFSCGTRLLVTAPDGRSVDVVVTDHGHYVSQWMDLSYAAFAQIADHKQGVIKASVKVLSQP